MRITRLRIRDFKGIDEACVDFPPNGVTVLEGPNEAGKSTLLEALSLLLDDRVRANSTAERVKAAQPIGRDAAPEVEVHLALGPYDMTFTKQYLRRPATLLEIHSPRRESLTGDDAHNRFHEIFGQHCDRTLWDALQVAQAKSFDQAVLAQSVVLRRALDDASDANGADEQANATLLQRARREYERYFTRRTASETGELAAVRRAAREADEGATDLARRVTAVEDLLASVQVLESELTELRAAVGPAREEAREHAELLAEVDALEKTLAERETATDHARTRLDAIAAELSRRRHADEQLAILAREVDEREARTRMLAPRLAEATSTMEATVAARRDGEQILERNLTTQKRASDDELLLRTEWELTQELERLTEAEDLQRERQEAIASLEGITVDRDELTRLQELAIEAGTRRRQAEEGSPAVTIEAIAALDADANGEPVVLAPGESATLVATRPLALHFPGLARVTVTPPPGAGELADQSRAAAAAFSAALLEARVTDLDDAQHQLRRRESLERTLAEAPERMRRILRDLPTITALRDKATREDARLKELRALVPAGYVLPGSISEAQARVATAVEQSREASRTLDAARDAETAAREQLDEIRTQSIAIDGELTILRPRLTEARSARTEAEATMPIDALARQEAEARDALAAATRDRDQALAALRDARPDTVRLLAENAARVAQGLEERVGATQSELTRQRAVLEDRSAEGLFEQAEDAAAAADHAASALEAVERRAVAARLLYSTLNDARTEAQRRYAGPLTGAIDQLGAVIYGPGFHVELGDDLSIGRRILDGTPIAFPQLSAGAKEQVAILARVATALLVDPDEGVPLIIDDALGSTDPERLKGMGAVLSRAGEHCQVIVLTCFPGRYQHVGGAKVVRLPG